MCLCEVYECMCVSQGAQLLQRLCGCVCVREVCVCEVCECICVCKVCKCVCASGCPATAGTVWVCVKCANASACEVCECVRVCVGAHSCCRDWVSLMEKAGGGAGAARGSRRANLPGHL